MLRRDVLVALSAGLLAPPALSAPRKATQPRFRFAGAERLTGLSVHASETVPGLAVKATRGAKGTTLLSLAAGNARTFPSSLTLGLSFAGAPGFRQGLAFWRYAPWKSWTKPMAMTRWGDAQADDIQCAYWQYGDGVYGVALPLGGNGFRATLGKTGNGFGTVCSALAPTRIRGPLPQVAIGFGRDLYAVMADIFEDAMTMLGSPENLRRKKSLPEALTWLGWNTWNASNLGHDLSAAWVLDQVDIIRKAGAPIRTVVLDDGHFQARDSRLQSQAPDPVKFPGGFKPVVDALLNDHGLKHVGLWHAFNAYWNGIDPESDLGRSLTGKLFQWTQKPSPIDTSGTTVTYSFLKPDPALLDGYFDAYHARLAAAGFTLIKVDNQLVAERMARDNYPVWDLATALHGALNRGAKLHFGNAMINCMDMTNDAFLNFGTSPVARSVEDYFPYKPTEGYDLQEGNAAAHVLQAMYNALYFGEMVFPDFDMFESTNPNARLHAAVRAANCAPIYVTDKAGQHDVALLKALVDAEGRTLRADTPLRPVADCLFQIQAPKLFKASSRVGDGALLLLANLADTHDLSGEARLSEVTGLPRGDYAAYTHYGRTAMRPGWTEAIHAAFARFRHDLIRIAPIRHGRAVLGLAEKLNGLASVRDVVHSASGVMLTAADQGTLLVWSETPPQSVTVDGKASAFTIDDHLVRIALTDGPRTYHVGIA
ncbi:Sip1-related alpha-galactosidase [Asticcacaulis solisilvae]|uniref:Sip1-related alpha-galactosidase n=1 Tax=Asticcacaulis solisilvae TaxID=1217274 RepID=UPI003FD7D3ED